MKENYSKCKFAIKVSYRHRIESCTLEAAAECCGFKWVCLPPGGQKKPSWWTREVEMALKQKAAFKKWLGNKGPSIRMPYVAVRKAAVELVANAETDSWEKFGEVLECNFQMTNKIF
ncbi:unnamed protein product [Soboliphyme baturini]|uniref:THUMP domain-containing protein n=1 Tax=Soboliphyme baturini TaxID=241478 RepID=A0A183IN26_9BILA|nr:unnamed protein product [Soboliphyme baturini]